MRITKISVRKLFGVFDHDIPLNDGGITIVIGENGLGKTVILEATSAFFGQNYLFFKDLEFSLLLFYFEGDEFWEVTKTQSADRLGIYVSRGFVGKDIKIKPVRIAEIEIGEKSSAARRRLDFVRHRQMMYHLEGRLPEETKFYIEDRRARDWALAEYLDDFVVAREVSRSKDAKPSWFIAGAKKISIRLIETQRIITAKERGGEAYVNRVTKSQKELAEMIGEIEKSASQKATELDSTYPNRLVLKLRQKALDPPEELNTALSQLDARRKYLSSVGLLEGAQDSDFLRIEKGQNDLVSALKLYIDDSHKKLAPYDQIAAKLQLLKQIVNKRFKHKTLEVDKKLGFVFRSTVKRTARGFESIPAAKLSSGEQNELILFYELIFKSSEGDMIFIDEPEVSLHISWQNKFIDDLKEVASINNVSIVIATHSPDIISENWDLKVELRGVE